MPRFVILEHDFPELHWDLMLECGQVLKTWRLARPPVIDKEPIPAQPLPDHRLFYLDYEGPISGSRGAVKKWDAGTYQGEWDQAPGAGWTIDLRGERVPQRACLSMERGAVFIRFLDGSEGT